MNVEDAMKKIIACPKVNGYAKSYARAYLNLNRNVLPSELEHAKKVQILYVLNNISHWRGVDSKEVRNVLKDAAK